MRKFYLPLFFLSGLSVGAFGQAAQGQPSGTIVPVNLSETDLLPAQPPQFSSTQATTVGQFYVKDDKPVTAQGQPVSSGANSVKRQQKNLQTETPAQQAAPKNTDMKTRK